MTHAPRRAPALPLAAALLALACADAAAQTAHAVGTSAPPDSVHVPEAPRLDAARIDRAYARAARLPQLRSLLVHWRGAMLRERYWHGATPETPANIKSASKSVISALVGIAIHQGYLRGTQQTLGELLPEHAALLGPDKRRITLGQLLSMQSGLASTSMGNYGAWVSSPNWVRYVLSQPLVERPGGAMIYSTGNTHLLSAILTRATGMSTWRYADEALAQPLGFSLRPWVTDPQGIYFGGNEMRMTPRQMAAFGRLYLNGGKLGSGRQLVPKPWVDASWTPRTRSPWSGDDYGYGWFLRTVVGERRPHRVHYAWGYGGQMIFVIPDLELVVVTTSDPDVPSRRGGHLDTIFDLLEREIVPAVGG